MAALMRSTVGPGELSNLLDWLEPPTTIDPRKPRGAGCGQSKHMGGRPWRSDAEEIGDDVNPGSSTCITFNK